METKTLTIEELQEKLAPHCMGTDNYYTPCFFNKHFHITDGVKHWADLVSGYWFFDIVGTEVFRKVIRTNNLPFTVLFLDCKSDNKFRIRAYSDYMEDETLKENKKNFGYFEKTWNTYTDMVQGTHKFYLVDGVLMLPCEY